MANLRRGFFRLWVVVAISWVGLAGYVNFDDLTFQRFSDVSPRHTLEQQTVRAPPDLDELRRMLQRAQAAGDEAVVGDIRHMINRLNAKDEARNYEFYKAAATVFVLRKKRFGDKPE